MRQNFSSRTSHSAAWPLHFKFASYIYALCVCVCVCVCASVLFELIITYVVLNHDWYVQSGLELRSNQVCVVLQQNPSLLMCIHLIQPLLPLAFGHRRCVSVSTRPTPTLPQDWLSLHLLRTLQPEPTPWWGSWPPDRLQWVTATV